MLSSLNCLESMKVSYYYNCSLLTESDVAMMKKVKNPLDDFVRASCSENNGKFDLIHLKLVLTIADPR